MIAYLQRKMPYNYFVYKRLLKEVQMRVENLKYVKRTREDSDDQSEEGKVSILDYGAGLGSGLWAAMHLYG